MIETAALFFSFACIPYAIDLVGRVNKWRSLLLFIFFATLAVLQKVTTGGPVLLILLLTIEFVHFRQNGYNYQNTTSLLYLMIVFWIPLAVGWAWAHDADSVKIENPLGKQLTSTALTAWNFGRMEQKLAIKTWRLVVWERSFEGNAGGMLGVLLLLAPWFGGPEHRRFAWLSLVSILLFVTPIAIFTNLHVVHTYYQVGCVAFLIASLSIVIGGWLVEYTGKMLIALVITLAIIFSNIAIFKSVNGNKVAYAVNRAVKIGHHLHDLTNPNTGLVIFGEDWSSEIAYYAQRKSLTAPVWFNEYKEAWKYPQKYLGNIDLGAIVVCPSVGGFPGKLDIQKRLSEGKDGKLKMLRTVRFYIQSLISKNYIYHRSTTYNSEIVMLNDACGHTYIL